MEVKEVSAVWLQYHHYLKISFVSEEESHIGLEWREWF